MTSSPNAADWIDIATARQRSGLRLLLLRGLPSPWSLAARTIFDLKRIPYARVYAAPSDGPDAVFEWTAQRSFPAAMQGDERPRSGWAEILLLAERLAPEPALLPSDPDERAQVFGISHEICGEMGLGWCRRLLMMEARAKAAPGGSGASPFVFKYGSGPEGAGAARTRIVEVLGMLAARLHRQQASGRAHLVGSDLTAADLYWACFAPLVALPPPEVLPLPDPIRALFETNDPEIARALDPALVRHRDWIYQRHLRLPIEC